MRLGVGIAIVLLGIGAPCFADAVKIAPGQTVMPGMSGFLGAPVTAITGSTSAGTISYSERVYADTMNPFCPGCYDFVLQVGDGSVNTALTSATLSGFRGQGAFAVGYLAAGPGDYGIVAPTAATESLAGDAVKFEFQAYFPQFSDPLILYTNTTAYGSGELGLGSSGSATSGLAALAPVAATPEPGSLWMLGSGLGLLAGTGRRLGVRKR